MTMRITYDSEADAFYIELRIADPEDSMDLEEGVTADLDADGHVIGLEILDARDRLGIEALSTVAIEEFPFMRRERATSDPRAR